ncbi:hypothetical protein [Actinomadura kijaniata]|uniref:hypothetical protein n=1 Tax=Actinomadura kijaniata TaxID=46161 RepID=UPI000AB8971F|nr:hypothetical protein [Actinomadura kijaniata]
MSFVLVSDNPPARRSAGSGKWGSALEGGVGFVLQGAVMYASRIPINDCGILAESGLPVGGRALLAAPVTPDRSNGRVRFPLLLLGWAHMFD